MVDAKSILDNIVRGAQSSGGGQPGSGGGLADILGDILKGAGSGQASSGGGGGLGDILGEIGKSLTQPSNQASPQSSAGTQSAGTTTPGGGLDLGKRLDDILAGVQRNLGQSGTSPSANVSPGAPPANDGQFNAGDILNQIKERLGQTGGSLTDGTSITDVLGKALAQATQGVREGAQSVNEQTGLGDALGRAVGSPQADELLRKLKDAIAQNPFAAGAAAGGLGGLVLGTKTGRSLASSAAKIGALAMIGGLAYKAVQNYQQGKPLITGSSSEATPAPAPAGSGYEPAAQSNDAATHYIQAMIAAAASDGRVDDAEYAAIVGSLKQAGHDGDAEAFIAQELNNPKSAEELARLVGSREEAVQVYTAARIAVADKAGAEQAFLQKLASALGLDPNLTRHIDATAQAAAA